MPVQVEISSYIGAHARKRCLGNVSGEVAPLTERKTPGLRRQRMKPEGSGHTRACGTSEEVAEDRKGLPQARGLKARRQTHDLTVQKPKPQPFLPTNLSIYIHILRMSDELLHPNLLLIPYSCSIVNIAPDPLPRLLLTLSANDHDGSCQGGYFLLFQQG